jgi:hypothetical protein
MQEGMEVGNEQLVRAAAALTRRTTERRSMLAHNVMATAQAKNAMGSIGHEVSEQ